MCGNRKCIIHIVKSVKKKLSPSTNAAYILIENTKTGIYESLYY